MVSRSVDAVVNIIGVDKGTSTMLKKLQSDAATAGDGVGNSIAKGSQKAGQALSNLGGMAASFGLPFAGALTVIGDKFAETATKGQKFASVVSDIGKYALIGGAAGLAAFGGEAIKLGAQAEEAQGKLNASVKASSQTMATYAPQVAAAQKAMESLGFTNADTSNALAKSDISTQNMTKSLSFLPIAADLARAKNIDLATAMDTVDRASTGNLRGLKSLGIDLPIAATSALKLQQANTALATAQANVNAITAAVPDAANAASAAHGVYEAAVSKLATAQQKLGAQTGASSDIIDALSKRIGGQATTYVDSFTGKTTVLTAQLKDMGSSIGEFLIPKLESAESWVSKNKGTVEDFAKAIGVVLGGAITVFAYQKAVDFVTGVGKITGSLAGWGRSMVTTQGVVKAQAALMDTEIESTGLAAVTAGGRIKAAFSLSNLVPGVVAGLATLGVANFLSDQSQNSLPKSQTDPTAKQWVTQDLGVKSMPQGVTTKPQLITWLQDKGLADTKQVASNYADIIEGVFGKSADDAKTKSKSTTDQLKSQNDATTGLTTSTGENAAATAASAKVTAAAAKAATAHAAALAKAKTAADAMKASIDNVTGSIKTLVSNALTSAQSALASAQSAFTSFASSTSGSLSGNFSFSAAESAGLTTGETFMQSLSDQADQTYNFTEKVKELLHAGLSQDALSQVLAAGATAGTDIADQLLAGGADAINQANQMTAAIQNFADSVGGDAAGDFYSAGVSQAQSIVDGLADESAKLAPKLKKVSLDIAKNLKSQVEIDLSVITGGGKVSSTSLNSKGPSLTNGNPLNLPGFATGGIVPGPAGMAQLIIAHGGERVQTSAQQGGGDVYNINVVANGADGQSIVDALAKWQQNNGAVPIKTR